MPQGYRTKTGNVPVRQYQSNKAVGVYASPAQRQAPADLPSLDEDRNLNTSQFKGKGKAKKGKKCA